MSTDDDLGRHLSPTSTTISDVHAPAVTEKMATAMEAIVSFCGQVFTPAAADSTQYAWPTYDHRSGLYEVKLDRPVHAITSVSVDASDDGTYATAYTVTTDYLTEPRGGVRDGISGWPTTHLRLAPSRSPRCSGFHESVKIIGKVGWAAVPSRVDTAQLQLAAQLMAQGQTPTGIVGFGDFGGIRLSRELYRQVSDLLMPLCLVGGTGLGGFA